MRKNLLFVPMCYRCYLCLCVIIVICACVLSLLFVPMCYRCYLCLCVIIFICAYMLLLLFVPMCYHCYLCLCVIVISLDTERDGQNDCELYTYQRFFRIIVYPHDGPPINSIKVSKLNHRTACSFAAQCSSYRAFQNRLGNLLYQLRFLVVLLKSYPGGPLPIKLLDVTQTTQI